MQERTECSGVRISTFWRPLFGNAPRNQEQGPTLNNLSLGLFKNFKIKERVTFQARLEAFNALNHPNPAIGALNNGLAAGTLPAVFVASAGSQDGYGDFGGITLARRIVQIGFKLIF